MVGTGPLESVGASATATDRVMSLPWKVLFVFSNAVLLCFLSFTMNHTTAQLHCKKKPNKNQINQTAKLKPQPQTKSSSEVKLTRHQGCKPPTVQINCTAFGQLGQGTHSPTQLNLVHPLRLLLWAEASKQAAIAQPGNFVWAISGKSLGFSGPLAHINMHLHKFQIVTQAALFFKVRVEGFFACWDDVSPSCC